MMPLSGQSCQNQPPVEGIVYQAAMFHRLKLCG
uniref:Uncharacterized protein n=1 Tax=Anguilla anguilla TaxID=7936 RepID=A0A0E9VQ00_ANGAN